MIEYKTDAICLPYRAGQTVSLTTDTVTRHLNRRVEEGWRLVAQSGGDAVIYLTFQKGTAPEGLVPT